MQDKMFCFTSIHFWYHLLVKLNQFIYIQISDISKTRSNNQFNSHINWNVEQEFSFNLILFAMNSFKSRIIRFSCHQKYVLNKIEFIDRLEARMAMKMSIVKKKIGIKKTKCRLYQHCLINNGMHKIIKYIRKTLW